jgi:hypothetical protein
MQIIRRLYGKTFMIKFKNALMLVFIIVVTLSFNSCKPSVPTIKGPEASHLLNKTQGFVICNSPYPGIKVISLPTLKERTITTGNTVHSLSGPDKKGRIAFMEDYFGDVSQGKKEKHLLKTILLDGTDEQTIFERSGAILFTGNAGKYLALSNTGNYLAFVSNINFPHDINGSIEIWDVKNKKKINAIIPATDGGLAWIPDGKRLAYSGQAAGKKWSLKFPRYLFITLIMAQIRFCMKDGTLSFHQMAIS